MINEHLCHDPGSGHKPAGEQTPTKKPKAKRPKIISPSRQKYETHFERYFVQKHAAPEEEGQA